MLGLGLDEDVRLWFEDAAAGARRKTPSAKVPGDLIEKAIIAGEHRAGSSSRA